MTKYCIHEAVLFLWILAIPFLSFAGEPAQDLQVETLKVLTISAQDERAVVMTEKGVLYIVNVGDRIGKNGKITAITANKIVIEETEDQVIVGFEDGKQRIERIKKTEARPPLLSPE